MDRSALMQVFYTEADLGKPVKDLRLRELLILQLSFCNLVFERAAWDVLHDGSEPLCLRLEDIEYIDMVLMGVNLLQTRQV